MKLIHTIYLIFLLLFNASAQSIVHDTKGRNGTYVIESIKNDQNNNNKVKVRGTIFSMNIDGCFRRFNNKNPIGILLANNDTIIVSPNGSYEGFITYGKIKFRLLGDNILNYKTVVTKFIYFKRGFEYVINFYTIPIQLLNYE